MSLKCSALAAAEVWRCIPVRGWTLQAAMPVDGNLWVCWDGVLLTSHEQIESCRRHKLTTVFTQMRLARKQGFGSPQGACVLSIVPVFKIAGSGQLVVQVGLETEWYPDGAAVPYRLGAFVLWCCCTAISMQSPGPESSLLRTKGAGQIGGGLRQEVGSPELNPCLRSIELNASVQL